MHTFNFANPWLFFLLPLPWLLRLWVKAAKPTEIAALKVPFFAIVANMASRIHPQTHLKPTRIGLAYLIWILLIIAIAGPQWLGAPLQLPRSGRDIMLAVDLSGSMRIPDMTLNGRQVNRLAVVKAAGKKFIAARTGDRLGLILFGSKAYLQTPLTYDRKTVEQMLADASIGLAGNETAIGDAIGLAIKQLSQAPAKSRVLILLTDGANNSGAVSPIAAAKVAAKEHIRIFTIGLGANQIMVNSVFGPQIINAVSALDEKTLKSIAKITDGLFFRAENSNDLSKVYTILNHLVPVENKKQSFHPTTPLYPWPLALALLLSLWFAWPYIRDQIGWLFSKPKEPIKS